MDYREARQAVQVCEKAGIVLAVNQNMRYDQSVRAARRFYRMAPSASRSWPPSRCAGFPLDAMAGGDGLGHIADHVDSSSRYVSILVWRPAPDLLQRPARPTHEIQPPGRHLHLYPEYDNGLRSVGIDDTWTGPAREGCPPDIYIKWRIEGLNGLAIGDIGWCRTPYTTPSTIRYAKRGDEQFVEPTWTESWFPDAFIERWRSF